jgi:hypothetical protein
MFYCIDSSLTFIRNIVLSLLSLSLLNKFHHLACLLSPCGWHTNIQPHNSLTTPIPVFLSPLLLLEIFNPCNFYALVLMYFKLTLSLKKAIGIAVRNSYIFHLSFPIFNILPIFILYWSFIPFPPFLCLYLSLSYVWVRIDKERK